jgi:formylmethanofuran dehydrogenase subunit B
MRSHIEIIICPECGRTCDAEVTHTSPFSTYVHVCKCGHIITESEWQMKDRRGEEQDE